MDDSNKFFENPSAMCKFTSTNCNIIFMNDHFSTHCKRGSLSEMHLAKASYLTSSDQIVENDILTTDLWQTFFKQQQGTFPVRFYFEECLGNYNCTEYADIKIQVVGINPCFQ